MLYLPYPLGRPSIRNKIQCWTDVLEDDRFGKEIWPARKSDSPYIGLIDPKLAATLYASVYLFKGNLDPFPFIYHHFRYFENLRGARHLLELETRLCYISTTTYSRDQRQRHALLPFAALVSDISILIYRITNMELSNLDGEPTLEFDPSILDTDSELFLSKPDSWFPKTVDLNGGQNPLQLPLNLLGEYVPPPPVINPRIHGIGDDGVRIGLSTFGMARTLFSHFIDRFLPFLRNCRSPSLMVVSTVVITVVIIVPAVVIIFTLIWLISGLVVPAVIVGAIVAFVKGVLSRCLPWCLSWCFPRRFASFESYKSLEPAMPRLTSLDLVDILMFREMRPGPHLQPVSFDDQGKKITQAFLDSEFPEPDEEVVDKLKKKMEDLKLGFTHLDASYLSTGPFRIMLTTQLEKHLLLEKEGYLNVYWDFERNIGAKLSLLEGHFIWDRHGKNRMS